MRGQPIVHIVSTNCTFSASLTVWPFLNFKMLPIHLVYCQDFSSRIIELLFPIKLKKTLISLQMYKARVPPLLAELPLFYFWMEKKKSSLGIVKWTLLANIWRDSVLFLYLAVQFMDILSTLTHHLMVRFTLQFFNYYAVHDKQQWEGCFTSFR